MKAKTLKTCGMTKKCTKCKTLKPASDFYLKNKEKGWLRPECKVCSNRLTTERRKQSLDGYWYVYKIVDDHYVGITSDLKSRKASHKHNGLKAKSMIKIAKYKKPEYAIIHEAIMHLMGWKGCSLKPKGQ
jgi:hypothetical protein